ncbi:MAG TPA: CRISPR-associated endonuclease Cas1 [Bacteroidales bacterium]|nr:CRISPR-associated endonuclease Cas1 [Bacteroidales bacterium]HOK75726.1 CRISPR-associated endonuclease Cas1 [Bacteroidales bacterium]HOM40512.1 CRISPR-associated endonuclease Cas1 [Bacteroidales bacterium]HPP93638.1 CRISPR-associated endonuclease Cas1 [Bacteroidales bacterium]
MELIINTFGTSLTRDNENFVVVHKDGKQIVPPSGISSITISRGAQITSDAALLAIENEIEVLFVDNTGNPVGRIWSSKYGSVSTIRKNQIEFTFSSAAVDWIKEIICRKIENQQALLLSLMPEDNSRMAMVKEAINKLEDYRNKINQLKSDIISDIAPGLRGWEGASSKVYFRTVAAFLPEKYCFDGRTKHPATDIINCLLNYGYGVLYGKVESALIKAGIDPYVGIFHRDDYNRPVLVYDVIELFRVWVDYVVISLARQDIITEECYSVRDDNSYWLEALGKRILIQSLNDYFDEIIMIDNLERSRITHINLYAQSLAKMFLNFNTARNASDR